MQHGKLVFSAILLLLMNARVFSQQLKLGKNPYVVTKSAVLELESPNQGLLFPRITDTSQINALTPPDGMVIFHVPSLQLLLRSSGVWKPLTVSSALSNYWSTAGNAGTSAANFLGTTDLRHLYFRTNNVQAMILDSAGNVGIGASPIFSTAANREKFLVDAGGNITTPSASFNVISGKGYLNNYLQLNIQNRSPGTNASSDIVATSDNGDESSNYVDLGINSSGNTANYFGGINDAYLYNLGQNFLIGTGTAAKSLIFLTGGGVQGTNERMRIDGNGKIGLGVTSPTALLHLKAGSLSANTAPLKFTSGPLMTTSEVGAFEFLTDNPTFTITTGVARKQFTLNDAALTAGRVPYTTTNGRLIDNGSMTYSSNRLAPTYLTLGAGTAAAGTAPLVMTAGTNLTTPLNGAIEFNGTHFYATIGSTRYVLDQQAGTIYTGSNGITLVGNDFRNNLVTGIVGDQTVTGGTASGNSLILSSTSNTTKGKILFGTSGYNEANNRLGLGNNIPTEVLDVAGNVKFSGALMPNNIAGTAGFFLASSGAGAAPVWTVFDTTSIAGFAQKVQSLFSGTSPITYSNGVISITQASSSTNGYLSSADWNTFNSKQGALTFGNVTGTDFGITGGTGAVVGSGLGLTLATVNTNTGSFGSTTVVPQITVNGKGLITAVSPQTIAFPVTSVNTATGAVSLGISNMNDATITTPATNQVLQYNGTKWVNATPSYISSAITSLNGLTAATQTFATPGTSGTAPNWSSTGSVHTLNIPLASATSVTAGLLSNTDWNTFNNKLSTIDTGNIANFYIKSRSLLSAGTGIGYNNATGVISNAGVLSVNGNTGALTMDTGYISSFAQKTRSLFSGAAPITYANGVIGITQASTSTNGYLSSTDWNTFNSKLGSVTSGNLTEAVSGVLTITGGTGAVLGSGTSVQVKQASTSQSGFLSNTDWNTFNNKLSTIDTGNIANFYIKSRSLLSAGTGIGYNNATGVISNTGVLSVNGNVGALTMDTTYISSFAQKTRSLFSGTAPITYANGVIGITQASTSTNGYLSSTDWNTFNSKAGTANVWSLTGNSGTTSGTNFIGTIGSQSLVMRTNNLQGFLLDSLGNVGIGSAPLFTSSPNREKFLVDAGTNAANDYINVVSGKGNTNNYLQVNIQNRSAGTAASSDIVATNNLGTESTNYIDMGINSSGFATGSITGAPNTAYLFATGNDFVIGNQTSGKPLRFYTTASTISADAMLIDSVGRVGIANAAPTQKLDVTGNVRFSGALMPNNNAGTAGYYLSSTGAGTAPTWNAFDTTSIAGFSQKVRSLFAGTAPITYSNGQFGITQASSSTNGYLSSADWNTFNSKASSYASGNLTESGSSILTITGGTNAVLGSGTTLQVKQANASQNGFLSSTDWTTFNSKQGALTFGNVTGTDFGITGGTGAVVGSGLGLTLATVNTNTGSFGSTTVVPQITVNGKGLITAVSPQTIAFPVTSVNSATGTVSLGISNMNDATITTPATNQVLQYNGTKWVNATPSYISSAITSLNGLTAATQTFATPGTSGTAPTWSSTGSVHTLNIPLASATSVTAGLLSNTDWNTFNNKLSTIDTGNIANFYIKSRSLLSAGTGIGYNNATGVISNAGVLSVNGNIGALTMDTGYISSFAQKTRSLFSGTAPITYANGVIGITQASTSTNGYLSSADWNTFNSKAASYTSGNLTETGSSILTITGGTGAVLGSGTSVQVKQASASQSGFLSNTDWNTFNNKLSTIDTGNIANFYIKSRSLLSAGTGIGYNNATGVISNTGVLSVNGNTGALTMDTGYISSFAQKTRSLFSGTAPITYANGVIGITQASTSTNGYLSSTDWNTFNSKAGTANVWSLTGNSGTTSGTNFIGTIGSQSLVMRTNSLQGFLLDSLGNVAVGSAPLFTASPNREKFLVDAGTNAANDFINVVSGKGSTNNYLQVNIQNRSAGTAASSDVVATNNLGTESTNYIDMGINSSGFATGSITGAPNTAYLFATGNDFVIGNQTAGKPLRFYTTAGAVSADAMLIDSAGRVGIANAAPTQKLDVTGNVRFSGALMPNNNAGTAGYYLSSTGAGTAPTWNAFDTTSIGGFSQKVRSLFAGTAPITYSNGQFGITQASSSTNGYLSSADWNTFNGKLGSVASGNLTETGSGVLTITGGTGAVLGSGTTVQVKQATTSQNGFLSSADWNTFNNKLSTIDTTNISSFSTKVRSLFSGTAPITYTNGLIGITQASTSTNGYLSSTDWNTFNGKASAANVWSLTGNSGTNSATNFLGTTDLQHLFFRTNNVQGMVLDSLGNLGVGVSPSFTAANREKLLVDAGITSSFNVISGKGSINNYLQLNIQNKSAGTIASSDVVATADNGDETTNYVDMGINSSANTSNYFGNANDSYLYNIGQNFLIGTGSPAKSLVFLTGGGTQTTNERMRIDGSGNIGIGTNNPLNKLSILGTNPLFLSGVQTGSLADSLVTISSGTIKKISVSSLSSLAVSSVGLSLPSIFSVSGSPVTTTGTLTGTLVVQPANKIFAGPASGADAVPTFRSLVAADLPIATTSTLGGISVGSGLAVTPSGVLSATNTNGGTVTTVSATGTQGVTTSVTNATTTPAITIGLGAITPTSVAATGTVTGTNLSGTNTGDQTINLTGDVSGSGTGSFATTVTGNAITYAKIQQAAANKLLGNPTGSTANVSEITLGSGLSFVGSTLTYTPATSGTVTSVGLSLPSIFTVTNSPVTSSGTLTGTLNTQNAKLFFAGPATGSAAPTFRLLAATDLPIATNTLVGGVSAGTGLSVNGAGVLTTTFNLASLSATAPVAYNNTTGFISLPKATGSVDGYLSSADWTIFNAKLSTIDTSNISNFYVKSRSLLSAGSGISYNAGTGVISSSINTANFWSLNGNTVTTAKTLGTIDNNDLPFITNNTEKMRLTATGFLGIGTSAPATALHVAGTNPLTLMGVQLGSNTDSILTIASGTVKKLPFSSLTSGTSWSLTGNSGTNSATNFLGTTDLQHLFFRTNNLQGMVLDSLGNLGIGLSPSFTAANREKLLVDAGTTNSFNVISGKGSINNYLQLNIQNKSAGAIASSDVVATADNGDETTNYVDMGINSSGNTSNYFGNANDSYLYNIGQNFLIGTATPNKNLLFLTGGGVQSTNERMRIDGSGNVGIGVTNAANPLVVKDVMEIRRVGTISQLLFSNTASSGDFRIGGDGGDIFWQGGGGRSLQMGSFWGMVLAGDRQTNTTLPLISGFTGTSVLVASPRDATVPLGIQGFSGTQSANLTEWRASSGSVFDVVDKSGNFGLGTTAPTSKLHVVGTNPLTLLGVQTGSATDSLLTITTAGIVRKLPYSTFTTGAISSLNGLTAATQTFAVPGTSGTAPAWVSSGAIHTLNIPLASTASVTAGLLSNTDWNTFNNKASTANVWSLTGNSGSTSGSNFLGTIDNKSLVFRTFNTQAMLIDSVGSVAVGDAPTFTAGANREQFLVDAGTSSANDFINVISGKASTNNYMQVNIQNRSSGTAASSDIVASNNTGNESTNYIDMGINSTGNTSTGVLGGNNTAYLYATGSDFSLGNASVKPLRLFTGGTAVGNERMRIDSSGNVGIANLAPVEKLDVTGNIKFSGSLIPTTSAAAGTFLQSNGNGVAASWLNPTFALNAISWGVSGNNSATTSNFLGTTDNVGLYVRTKNVHRFYIDTLGNVAIGTGTSSTLPPTFSASPNQEKLLVDGGSTTPSYNLISGKGTINNYLQLNIQNKSTGSAASSDVVATNDAGTEANQINFVDMGVNGSGNTSTGVLGGANNAYLYATGTDFTIGNSGTGVLKLYTGTTEDMRIDVAGNVGIGTTAPTQRLDVNGNINAGGSIYTDGNSVNTGTVYPGLGLGGSSSGESISSKRTSGTNQYGIDFYTASNLRMTVYNTGKVGIGTGVTAGAQLLTVNGSVGATSYVTNSDRRLKTHIENLNYGLKEILSLQPVKYNWKKTPDTDKQLGLIAQDVRKIVPEVVAGDESKENLGLNYSELVPVLINAIKEQQKQIDDLKQQVIKLQKKS